MTKQEAINYINTMADDAELDVIVLNKVISSSQVEELGISRQLLGYHVRTGQVRTVAHGKQKKYVLEDVLRLKRN